MTNKPTTHKPPVRAMRKSRRAKARPPVRAFRGNLTPRQYALAMWLQAVAVRDTVAA